MVIAPAYRPSGRRRGRDPRGARRRSTTSRTRGTAARGGIPRPRPWAWKPRVPRPRASARNTRFSGWWVPGRPRTGRLRRGGHRAGALWPGCRRGPTAGGSCGSVGCAHRTPTA
ncbi:hypothetical protein QJS66_01305 [Kocuria rhizophila]|nr:hypothetical protein QJS66_01305 [Kocuria rhizophila]